MVVKLAIVIVIRFYSDYILGLKVLFEPLAGPVSNRVAEDVDSKKKNFLSHTVVVTLDCTATQFSSN